MLFADGGLALVFLGVWIFCIIDVITTPEESVRNLPKLVWLLIVVLLSDVGSLAWLIAGRNWNARPDLPYKGNRGYTADARATQTRRAAAPRAGNPDDDEEFLAGLRARAEQQRRSARDAQQRQDVQPRSVRDAQERSTDPDEPVS